MRASMEYLAGQLIAEGIPATTDIASVSPPCVLIERPKSIRPVMDRVEMDISLFVLGPRPWNTRAWDAIDILVLKIINSDLLCDRWSDIDYQTAYVMPDGDYPAALINVLSYQF